MLHVDVFVIINYVVRIYFVNVFVNVLEIVFVIVIVIEIKKTNVNK